MALLRAHQAHELERAHLLLSGYGGGQGGDASAATPTFNPLDSSWHQLLVYADVSQAGLGTILVRVAISSLVSVTLAVFFRQPLLLAGAAIWIAAEYLNLRRRSFARAESFERDYTALLLSLASSARTGIDPLVGLTSAQDLFPQSSVIHQELRALSERIERGAAEESAINAFGATIDHPDIALFRTAFLLSRREGSSLSDCLQRLARVTRQRQSFRRKIRASVAMQKLSAYGIGVCAIVIGVMQVTSNPQAMQLAFHHPLASRALSAGIGLVVLGIVWMVNLTRSRI